jgi:hypothetical protein
MGRSQYTCRINNPSVYIYNQRQWGDHPQHANNLFQGEFRLGLWVFILVDSGVLCLGVGLQHIYNS